MQGNVQNVLKPFSLFSAHKNIFKTAGAVPGCYFFVHSKPELFIYMCKDYVIIVV